MSLKQTRRSVSLCAGTYQRLRDYAAAENRSVSAVVESLLAPVIGSEPPKKREPAPPKPERTPSEKRESRLRFNPPPAPPKPKRGQKPGPGPNFGADDPDRSRPKPTRATAKLRNIDGFDRALTMVGK